MGQLALRTGLPLAVLAILVACWAGLASRYPVYVLPGPDLVLKAMKDSWQTGTLRGDTITTLIEACSGWAIALLIALPLGYAVTRWRYLDWAVTPYLAGAQAVPVIAIAPLLFVWVGFGTEIKIILAAVISFFPLMTTTVTGLHAVSSELRDVARTFGANWRQRIIYLEAPQAARSILAGARIAILLALVGAYVGELVNPDHGLGALVSSQLNAIGNETTATAFAGVLCFVAMATVLYWLLTLLEIPIMRWTE